MILKPDTGDDNENIVLNLTGGKHEKSPNMLKHVQHAVEAPGQGMNNSSDHLRQESSFSNAQYNTFADMGSQGTQEHTNIFAGRDQSYSSNKEGVYKNVSIKRVINQ